MDQRQPALETVVIDAAFWRGRTVFLTGHTGFKGAWLSVLLSRLGAKVHGYALPPEHQNGLFCAAGVEQMVRHCLGDVRDLEAVRRAIAEAQPSVVIHMAAQSLVRRSYAAPVETYATNVMGTVNILEAVRTNGGVEAAIVVTSDKCYEESDSVAPYREDDRLGGRDPYSNSKGCAELVAAAYRQSFFSSTPCAVASARAGNVIGGGDWAEERLVPDVIRALIDRTPIVIRNPHAIRPWQHVLDPLAGYLVLAQRLIKDGAPFAQAWNFGPSPESEIPVAAIVQRLTALWGASGLWQQDDAQAHPHEAATLRLDSAKAKAKLGWAPALALDDALRYTVEWYAAYRDAADMGAVTRAQVECFLVDGARNEVNSAGARASTPTASTADVS
jgi:CDP-glucose 4,6-dehydratase